MTDRRALDDSGVDSDPVTLRCSVACDPAYARQVPATRVLGRNPCLDCMSPTDHVFLRDAQMRAHRREQQLPRGGLRRQGRHRPVQHLMHQLDAEIAH